MSNGPITTVGTCGDQLRLRRLVGFCYGLSCSEHHNFFDIANESTVESRCHGTHSRTNAALSLLLPLMTAKSPLHQAFIYVSCFIFLHDTLPKLSPRHQTHERLHPTALPPEQANIFAPRTMSLANQPLPSSIISKPTVQRSKMPSSQACPC
jgi:hypothetical protein